MGAFAALVTGVFTPGELLRVVSKSVIELSTDGLARDVALTRIDEIRKDPGSSATSLFRGPAF